VAGDRRRITADVDKADHERLKDVVYAAQRRGHARVTVTSATGLGIRLAAEHLACKIGFDSLDDVPKRRGSIKQGRPPNEDQDG